MEAACICGREEDTVNLPHWTPQNLPPKRMLAWMCPVSVLCWCLGARGPLSTYNLSHSHGFEKLGHIPETTWTDSCHMKRKIEAWREEGMTCGRTPHNLLGKTRLEGGIPGSPSVGAPLSLLPCAAQASSFRLLLASGEVACGVTASPFTLTCRVPEGSEGCSVCKDFWEELLWHIQRKKSHNRGLRLGSSQSQVIVGGWK